MSLVTLGIALPWLIVALGCWLGFQLLRQNGRLLLRLEGVEQKLGQLISTAPSAPPGLPVGSAAPEFELPDLGGGRKALSEFRGRKLLLIFFNPRCGFCTQMAPDLAALTQEALGVEALGVGGAAPNAQRLTPSARPLPLVVSTGAADENRQLVEKHDIRCPVLLQEKMEVASAYQANGTPIGYLIDERGRIASEIAVGAQALLALAAGPSAGLTERQGPAAASGSGHAALGGTRSVAESKINREGLPAGTPAPAFHLPRLDGGELSLEEYRGRQVLLVFSDPNCGPCDQLVPQLEQLARRRPDLPVLMVSRGDAEANRVKVAEHGLTLPVVLQRQWEISREYGTFATPVAYLIDAAGVIAADVAMGVEPILALMSGAAASSNGNAAPPPGRGGMPMRR
jgi:peroxiredoxin